MLGALDQIFAKYDYAPPRGCPQVINRTIKQVLENLSKDVPSLAETIDVIETKSGETMKRVPRYKAISNHSGRRSCATNMLDKGFSLKQIAARTGHKSLATLECYLRKTTDKYADEVARIQMEREKQGELLLF